MSKVTTCLTDLGSRFGDIDEEAYKTLKEQGDLIESTMRDAAFSIKDKEDILATIGGNMKDRYKQAILEKTQQKTTEATVTISILDKAREVAKLKGRELAPEDFKTAARELIWGEGGSVMFQKKALQSRYASEFYSRLLEKDALRAFKKAATSKDFNEELIRAIHDLSQGASMADLKLKKVHPREASEIYDAIRYSFDRMFYDKKQSGIGIGKQKNYIGRVRYGKERAIAMGEENFTKFMMKNIDADSSFSKDLASSETEQVKYFTELYKKIRDGDSSFLSSDDGGGFSPFLKSRLKERELVYKQGSSFEVFKELSPLTDLHTVLSQEMDESSSMITNFSFFGPTPDKSMKNVVDSVKKLSDALGVKGKTETIRTNHMDAFAAEMDKATFSLTEKPKNQITAVGYLLQSMNNLQVATKLGASAFSTALPTDITTTLMATMTDRGVIEGLKSITETTKRFGQLATMSDTQLVEFQKAAMLQVDIMNMTYQDRLGPEFAMGVSGEGAAQAITRGTSKFASQAMKYSLMDYQYKRAFLNGGFESLHTLGMMLDPSHADNKFLQTAFNDMNLTGAEKEVFKKLSTGIDGVAGGHKMLNLNSAMELDLKEFGAKSNNLNKARRTQLLNKIAGFANSRAGQSSPTPNLRTSFKKGNVITNTDMLMKAAFLFKNTIWHMTDIFGKQVGRVYDVNPSSLVGGAATMAGTSLGVYAATEVFYSALIDRKSKTLGLLNGEYDEFFYDFTSKMSTMPIYTDPVIRMIRQHGKWGQTPLLDFMTGPNASMLRDATSVLNSKNKGKAAMDFGARHLLPASNIMLQSAARHGFDYDIKNLRPQKKSDTISNFEMPNF